MQSAERPFPHRRGLIIVATLATAYVASHFFRASNVTIGLDLMRDLAIGPEALGALTGAFFFGFAEMQIPCGFFFDRFGPRYTVVGMLIIASLGGAMFTLAPSWPVLLTGRALLGAGPAPYAPALPASALLRHPDCRFHLDAAAAARLE
mgnify:CR=1 FL=1